MAARTFRRILVLISLLAALSLAVFGQSGSALLNGTITDSSGATVPNAQVELKDLATGIASRVKTGADGLYSFPQVGAGAYELRVTAAGFRDFVQKGLKLNMNDKVRVDVSMQLGTAQQTVEVEANASMLNFENAEQKAGVAPETMGQLPLMVSGGVRSAANFLVLLPGATSPTGDVVSAHLNGAVQYSGEALLNGGSLVNPSGGNGMWSAAFDFAQSPDMVSELKVLQSNYEPQYGSTGGAVVVMETKSGSNQFHGSAFEFLRNTALNARQFNVDQKPRDIENDFGGTIGGPVKVPVLWTKRNKTYFFFNWEGFRQVGAPTRNTYSIPSLLERQGDFSDWADSNGKMIPIFDPATSRTLPDGTVTRDQFMGCDGQHPNVICPTRFQNTLALGWIKYLPQPSSPGPKNNFVPTGNGSIWNGRTNLYNIRIDEYVGDKDHFTGTVYHRNMPVYTESQLPDQISTDSDTSKYTWSNRINWDHVFGPTLLNHLSGGYNHDFYQAGGHDAPYAKDLPQIKGAPSQAYPPRINFGSGFQSFGTGSDIAEKNRWPAPAWVFSDLLTWVEGKHTLKFGFEYRNLRNSNMVATGESGTAAFDNMETGLRDVNSGSPIASFLLGLADSGSLSVRPYGMWSARWGSWIAHVGDTWKVTPKLSVNLGLRWEMHKPTVEQHDVFSYLDPGLPNPSAGGLPGSLVFAGTRWGQYSSGQRYPEQLFTHAFAPRVGIAYSLAPKTVMRAGYGIFYDAGYYPGWMSGIAQDGFNLSYYGFGSQDAGLTPAFKLTDGLPGGWPQPPFLDPGFLNGQSGPIYRPKDANRLPYSGQWNLAIEHQFTKDTTVTVSYVGTKGTRLTSNLIATNALNPGLMNQYGNQLYDTFNPGDTMVDGVKAPYTDWASQMTGCAPTVGQALLPFPQYCGGLTGINENAGNSTYHSLQVKAERRFSNGLWFLVSYTGGKLITDTESNQPGGAPFSPYERRRNKALSSTDIPQTLVTSVMYNLPFGKGHRWANQNKFEDLVLGGWQISTILRVSSGPPLGFYSSNCNVPGQFRASCLPGPIAGANLWAQDKGSINVDKPLLNSAAFEDPNTFNFYTGAGSRTTNLRSPGYHNQDLTLMKGFNITEKVVFQVRGDFFNVYNWHTLTGFDTDVASPAFGMWNGGVTNPRYVQVGGRIQF